VALVFRNARVASSPLPSGRRRSMITTSGCSAPASRIASAAVEASPTTSNWRSRSNACRSPRRIRSWSSTSSTFVRVAGVALVVIRGALSFGCSYATASGSGSNYHGNGRTRRVSRLDLQPSADTVRPFFHDRKAVPAIRP
jgi:hypothetical protein